MRYISRDLLVMIADGDPWQVNSTLQSGCPAQIADLAQAFHDAGYSTKEAQTAFGQARQRFGQSWFRESGEHPINDSADVQRATASLGVQAVQLPGIAVALRDVAAGLADAQQSAGEQIATLDARLQRIDDQLGEAVELENYGQLSAAERSVLDQHIADLEQQAIDETNGTLHQIAGIRDSYSRTLDTSSTGLQEDGFDPGPTPVDWWPGEPGDEPRRWTDKDLYPHDPTAADIHQDSIGDCYFDATMGAIANANPQWIKDRIRYDDTTGNFDVTLWDGHQWKHIPVTQNDIDTDISQHGAGWLDNDRPNAALWPTVLESAYAKLKYPGQSLTAALGNETGIGQGGQTKDALEALTGNRGTNVNPGSVWLTNQHIDQEICTALTNHQPVTISTTPNGAPLVESHAYTVESITGTGSDARVTLRNPWEFNPGDPDSPLITVRLGDLIGSGLPDIDIPGLGEIPSGPLGKHPTYDVNIGSLG